ncbi:Lsr2 family protein [Auraticoccus sp. F435]|uniref:Lsr2 family protein n=1 Tax=Auraticoccus cholistanensis TaxID=2656650 RepID=A0A6A9UW99_9ACTN|nr:Lsr2 family protein [Auraticoccus cholistanensis]MVA76988.1 Lsr2 family protein [Auraticoccus cholistanensis]
MAQRVEIVLTDDVDNGPADQTVTFALDGVEYEIDLSDSNAEKLRADLAPWVGHARRSGGRRKRASAAPRNEGRASATEVRAWAAENGMEVSSRGRVPTEVREAYERAHS